MADSSPFDKWLVRIQLIGSLIISVVALYVSLKTPDETVRKLGTEMNERVDSLNQSFGEMKQSFTAIDQQFKKLEQDSQALVKKIELQAVQSTLAKFEASFPNHPELADASQKIGAAQTNLDQLLQGPLLSQNQAQFKLSPLLGLQTKPRQWDWLSQTHQDDLSKLLAKPSTHFLTSPPLPFPELRVPNLQVPIPEKKGVWEDIWVFIKTYPIVIFWVVIVIGSLMKK